MMRKRKRIVLVLALIVLAFVVVAALWSWTSAAPKKPHLIARGDYTYTVVYAEYRIRRLMKQHHLPSVAAALIDDQDVIWQEAFGLANVEEEIEAAGDTVYKLWSVAKVFTAIETMRLVEEGQLDLDAPITDYVPDFSIQSRFPDSEPVTIRSILAHHSGLPRNECHTTSYTPGQREVLGALVESLKDCQLAYPVGSRFKYTNIGPDLLGTIIQEKRGESFPRTMKDNLLMPIGMENSAFLSVDIPAQKDFAMGYEYYKGEYYPIKQGDITSLPSGNLYSTLEDMSNFARFIFRDGEANGKQLIKPETLWQTFEDQYASPRDPQPMGLGWKTARVLGSELLVWHDGGPLDGTGSIVALLPERKLGFILFANEISLEGSISISVAIEMLERMLETKYGVIPPEDEPPAMVDVDPSVLEGYVGKYIAFGQVMEVTLSGGRLKGSIQGMKLDLVPVDETRFKVGHWLMKLGLVDLLRLPIDFQELEIEFLVGEGPAEDVMMINISDIIYEICPRYPEVTEIPAFWEQLSGVYELVGRQPSGKAGRETIGWDEILVEDGVLMMPSIIGPIQPTSETEIIILSGPFAGEMIVYDPHTGYLSHQWVVYKPTAPDPDTKSR